MTRNRHNKKKKDKKTPSLWDSIKVPESTTNTATSAGTEVVDGNEKEVVTEKEPESGSESASEEEKPKKKNEYRYEDYRLKMTSNKGQKFIFIIRDHIVRLLQASGAFRTYELSRVVPKMTAYELFAALDRLEELGEIELTNNKPKNRLLWVYNGPINNV